MNRLLAACILLAMAGGCALGSREEPLAVERAHTKELMTTQGMSPDPVGATTGSGGGEVGFEYWKH